MTFLSLSILLWMAGTAAAAWCLPRSYAHIGLVVICIAFMALNAPVSLAILLVSACISYGVIKRFNTKTSTIMALVVLFTSVLVCFKAQNRWGVGELGDMGAALPLGISYYLFRQIHYVFEAYKKKLPPHTLIDYFSYLFFLPTLLAGPIHLFASFKRDMSRRRWDSKNFSHGLERVLYGYAKIVILGNYVVSIRMVDWIENQFQDAPLLSTYLDCIRYSANLYFQFSGYTDVAVGFSLIIGVRVIENFKYPFLAVNINDFWTRWHISLSSWCRSYVYTPIASATRKPLLAILISMIVLGLWHEISLRYLAWGIYHGLGIGCWHIFQRVRAKLPPVRNKFLSMLATMLAMLLTMNFVLLSFVITKENTVAEAIRVLSELLFFWR